MCDGIRSHVYFLLLPPPSRFVDYTEQLQASASPIPSAGRVLPAQLSGQPHSLPAGCPHVTFFTPEVREGHILQGNLPQEVGVLAAWVPRHNLSLPKPVTQPG